MAANARRASRLHLGTRGPAWQRWSLGANKGYAVNESRPPTDAVIERIRLFFPLAEEERIAVALTSFFGRRAGARIGELRPDMSMGEVLDLAEDNLWTTAEFGQMLELAGIQAFDEQFEQMTFRDFVRYSAVRESERAQPGAE